MRCPRFRVAAGIQIVAALLLMSVLYGRADAAGPAAPAAAARSPADQSVRIEQFSPQGMVKGVREVMVRFSAPMVALGDPRLPDPLQITCPAPGKGRWADGRNWIYDFDEDLPAGVRCTFTPKKSVKAVNGARLVSTRSYSFNTGGPSIIGSMPHEGSMALDEEQLFLLKLNAPATFESIQAHASCVIDGVSERVPVAVLTGAARDAVMKERAALGYDYFELLWKTGRVSNARVRNRSFERVEDQITALRCQRRLPYATKVRLNWGKGVSTPSGIATAQDQVLAFSVRAAFTAQVECARTNAHAGCIPMQPIRVNFTAPVPRALAMSVRLKGADGRVYEPSAPVSVQAPTVEGVTFAAPFPDSAPLTVTLPDRLVDDAGRPLENAARFPLDVQVAEYPALAKFYGNFGILEAREGGVLPVTLRNLEPKLSARLTALPAKMLKLTDDPALVASWLRRVDAANEQSGEWVEAEKKSADALHTKIEEQQAEDAEGRGSQRVWREKTGTHSVFGSADNTRSFSVDKPAGQKPAEVIGISLQQTGFYVVELSSRILGASLLSRDETRYVTTAALVTNLAVHFKWGRESSRVWVTRLDNGAPVNGADIAIIDYCSGASVWKGRTGADGVAAVRESLGAPHGSATCSASSPAPLLAAAAKDGDFSFTQSGWGQGIDPYQFSVPVGNEYSADIYHTMLDRPLFRAGETVSMKHFLRHHQMAGIAVLNGVPARRKVVITHQGSGQRYELEAEFGADGIAESTWKIPVEAKLGDYRIAIASGAGDAQRTDERQSGRFKVEQFRLPSMRGSVTTPALPQVRPEKISLDLHVAYLSGGGALARNWSRKIGQIRTAHALEGQWTKQQILEAYLNLVEYRGELQGIAAAAQVLAGKAPSGLSVAESQVLAALLPDPAADRSRLETRACARARGRSPAASCAQVSAAVAAMLGRADPLRAPEPLAPQLSAYLLKEPGERVQTTLDAGIQRLAAEALRNHLGDLANRNVRDGAVLVVDNASGAVLAYVGSSGALSRARHADGVRARRQAGSTLKPFLYELALERRYLSAASLLEDSPLNLDTGTGVYVPQDYDHEFKGLVSLRTALGSSLNVPAVRTLVIVGVQPFRDRLYDLGFEGITEAGDYYGFSLALGSADVSLWEEAQAYRTLARGGRFSPLKLRLEESTAPNEPAASDRRILPEASSFIVGDILSDPVARSVTFGLDNHLNTPFWSAAKTGTSKDMRDNWCIGYSREFTVAVWVGNFEGDAMHDVSGVTGAAPVWHDVITILHQNLASLPPAPPPGLVTTTTRFAPAVEPARLEWYLAGTQTNTIDAVRTSAKVARFVTPANGMIIALDPDIPLRNQRIPVTAQGVKAGMLITLNDKVLGPATQDILLTPSAGAHHLALQDGNGHTLDRILFTVR